MSTPTPSAEDTADHALLRRIAAGWHKRATVRADLYTFEGTVYEDPARPDYPAELVPFNDHPRFQAASPEQRQAVLTWAWLAYNDRTVALEEHLANPAFTLIMHDAFPGATDIDLRKAVQQCLIDEHFHTYMHMAAMHDTRRYRRLGDGAIEAPPPSPVRRLRERQAQAYDGGERALVSLAFGVVAEVSVKDFLNLMASNETIQPAHRRIALLHNRDEYAHGQILAEVTKVLWQQMNGGARRSFVHALPAAIDAFVEQDFSTFRAILDHVGVAGAKEIIDDTAADAGRRAMLRDLSSIKRLLAELGVLEQVRDLQPMECLS